ncbi:UvrD-helicase domain-containing protein [Embleya sp. NPDC005971]|uniref:UvrD-helicase domain-containing protein n=1 Tax=unclassified Embleya TaxID=2699296 RepID=UPI0033F5935B
MEPTSEQQAAREVFVAGRDLALIAGAGTGKTSTLVMMGNSTRKRGLYVAFNRGIADDARARFGSNMECRTAHSLAYAAGGHAYRERLNSAARLPARETARVLGLTRDMFVDHAKITRTHQARLVMGMVRRFCYSTDREITVRHMERINGLGHQAQDHVAGLLTPYAHRAWQDLRSLHGRLRFEHDHYLKMWALTRPTLHADFVLLDEAQDTNPVLEEIFLAQDAQRVCVGDPAQQIYAWRSARDVMTGFPAEHLHLTRSFRFGPRIAEVANRWLRHAESDLQLSGHPPVDSRIGPAPHADAVLCRGNADAMSEVLTCLEHDIPVALTGGGAALERIAGAAQELMAGRRTSHPELFLFASWDEVREYTEQDTAGQDLKAMVQLVDLHGPQLVIDAVRRLTTEADARVVVSTAHKAKGREWKSIRIGTGFDAPTGDEEGVPRPLNPAEARLIYVAVTRARHLLDHTGLDWIDAYEAAGARLADGIVAGRPMIELPLTRQLRYPASPMSTFMAAHLPESHLLVRDYLTRITDLPHPVQPIDVRYPDWAALGHAIDYRLRLSMARPPGPAVDLGVALVGSDTPLPGAPDPRARKALHTAGRDLLAAVHAHLAHRFRADAETLNRWCFVAAAYEDISRSGTIRRRGPLAAATASTTLAELLDAVPAYVHADLERQFALARDVFTPLRALPDERRICGPTFAGSADLGGADADFILGGTLIDSKATTRPRNLGREEIHQLAGYLLLDYDNRYTIDRVGLYLARQGALIDWPVDTFLRLAGATEPPATLRNRLRDHLLRARAARRRPPAS